MQIAHGPRRCDALPGTIDDGNVIGIRNIDKDPLARRLELERFRMTGQFYGADCLKAFGIDASKCAITKTDEYLALCRIVSNIIGVRTKLQTHCDSKRSR